MNLAKTHGSVFTSSCVWNYTFNEGLSEYQFMGGESKQIGSARAERPNNPMNSILGEVATTVLDIGVRHAKISLNRR